ARVVAELRHGKIFRATRVPAGAGVVDSVTQLVGAKQLDGFLIVTDAVVETGTAEYRASNVSSFRDVAELQDVLARLAVAARLERQGVDPTLGGEVLLARRQALVAGLGGGDVARQVFQMPHLSAATLGVFLSYFLGGFFLYSAMYAAVGAMSSNEQEARQAQQPVMFLLLIAYVSMFGLTNNPESTYAVTLSPIPFTAPIAMPVRWAASTVPEGEV